MITTADPINAHKAKILPPLLLALILSALGADSDAASPPDRRPKAEYKEERIPGTDRWISHHNFSKKQLDALRAGIAKLKFPQPGGTVDKLLPVRGILRSRGVVGDMLPNDKGLMAIHEDYFSLSFDYVLLLRQGHYANKKVKHGKSYFIDESAEVMPRNKIPKLGFEGR